MPTRRAVSLLLPARQLLSIFAALRVRSLAVRRNWDAYAAHGKVGPVMGLRHLHPDDKSRFTGFGPPSAALPPGGKARKSVAYGAAKPRPTPDFRSC